LTVEVNGVAHVMLTAGDFDKCVPFYEKLLNFLGLKTIFKTHETLYCVGGRTAVGLVRPDLNYEGSRFVQARVGLHHLCLRAREPADVDAVHEFAKELGAKIVHSPEEGTWAPGYYSVLFEDPDGIRIEVNHVPGKGLLAEA
jgi:catechol 2,3-dioxygenase-like lactoylglutathione lyase family enzyme